MTRPRRTPAFIERVRCTRYHDGRQRKPITRCFSAFRVAATLALLFAAWGTDVVAERPPQQMVKIVFRSVLPGIPPNSFAAQPVTLYQAGPHFQRVEEVPNPETGIHALIVSKNRDTWMANLTSKTGQHFVDNAVNYDVNAPVFGDEVAGFNFGSEIQYMEDAGVKPSRVRVGERDLLQYEHAIGPRQIRFMITVDANIPYAAGLFAQGRLLQMVRYVEYKTEIEPDFALFEKPEGITFVEVDIEATKSSECK